MMSVIHTNTPLKGKMLNDCKSHLLDQSYMSGIQRNQARIRATAEVFTPNAIVEKMIADLGLVKDCDASKRIIDPACGDGQFLAYILWYRIKDEIPLEEALSTLYGIDIMQDNVELCKRRLSCGCEDKKIIDILERNIIRGDALSHFPEFQDDDSWLPGISY